LNDTVKVTLLLPVLGPGGMVRLMNCTKGAAKSGGGVLKVKSSIATRSSLPFSLTSDQRSTKSWPSAQVKPVIAADFVVRLAGKLPFTLSAVLLVVAVPLLPVVRVMLSAALVVKRDAAERTLTVPGLPMR